MELYGTHGTSKSRTTGIVKANFRPGSRRGKAGTGVYFWAYDASGEVATELARNWWSWATDQGWYKQDSDKRCSIIYASLTIDSDQQFFDCSEVLFLEKLYETATKQGIENIDDVAALYDIMLSELEDELEQTFHIIKVNVPVPTSSYSTRHPIIKKLYSHYCAYIVRKEYEKVIAIIEVNSNK